MAENVRVVVRSRPMNKRELELKCHNIVHIEGCTLSVQNPIDLKAPAKIFTFDNVYDALAPTEAIYNDICYSLVDNVLEGYNGTIFAYGQTGCGKTHTMQGPDNFDSYSTIDMVPNSQRGIVTRTFEHIFEAISVVSDVRYLALVSYLEIYNENIRDLLNPNEPITSNHALKEIPGVGVVVPTLSSHTVHNANECYQLLGMGNRNRMVGATLMNAQSSRSHSIFTISLEQIHNASDDGDGEDGGAGGGNIRRGKLNLVDLAGSERQNKTGAIGERLKEATKINLSLSALGNVISALVDGKTKHIPYRDSKLTRLLQDSLGGNTKTLMISCISPADNNYDETLSTLRYASRAKNISNKPRINEDPKDAKLREYQEEIVKLKQMLHESSTQQTVATSSSLLINGDNGELANNSEWVEKERAKIQMEMEAEMQRLRADHMVEQREKDERTHEIEELREHYEQQLKQLAEAKHAALEHNQLSTINNNKNADETINHQLEARKRIESIKMTLIGGERANDTQLKERRQKKKLDAKRRLSALAHALSRVEQREDRDLLQGHYANIQQELNAKNEYLKRCRQKVKALEREVSDLQAEFQLDRADYLESIRRLERNLKFYQQIIDKALPILRKDGKYWDPNEIIQNSVWNDDLKIWKLPETSMNSFKLPPATTTSNTTNSTTTMTTKLNSKIFQNNLMFLNHARTTTNQNNESNNSEDIEIAKNHLKTEKTETTQTQEIIANQEIPPKSTLMFNNKIDILNNYFRRSNRQKTTTELLQQRKGFSHWKDFSQRNKPTQNQEHLISSINPAAAAAAIDDNNEFRNSNGSISDETEMPAIVQTSTNENRLISAWLPQQQQQQQQQQTMHMNRTWGGGGNIDKILMTPLQSTNYKMHQIMENDSNNNNNNNNKNNIHNITDETGTTYPYNILYTKLSSRGNANALIGIKTYFHEQCRRPPHKLTSLNVEI